MKSQTKAKKFSASWKSSTERSKQRKYRYNAPLHTRNKFNNAPLSKELSKKYDLNRISVRKGDTVKILRGQYKGKTGKINRVELKNSKVFIDGIDFTKKDGNKVFYPIHPSNLVITEMILEDKKRLKTRGKK